MKKWLLSLGIIAILVVLQLTVINKGLLEGAFTEQGPYIHQILILVGINIILAVSLNLINGYTGQFSIGHAGFFAVGAYTSAFFVSLIEPSLRHSTAFLPVIAQDTLLLLSGIISGASFAGLAGLAVGIPSLRLRGDYLAIVTLGFGEIIRVLIMNITEIGGSR
jgi:branched-chain amino acid transport system permease protein